MIKIPYGISDFEKLIREDYFYQDRTDIIPILENWNSNYPIFLRPRRFGKSLWISVLHYYYGLEHKNKFQDLFGKLYIGQQPTALANSFMILSFEFSRIDTKNHETTYSGFLQNTYLGCSSFLSAYSKYFSDEDKKFILGRTSPEGMVKALFGAMNDNEVPHKIYLLIDEYDHFANELLSFDMVRFKSNVTGNGFVRKFYESFKTATRDGIIDRFFITGVSPITLDSLTSGFNISDNMTLNPIFHNLMGFTHAETEELLRKSDIPEEKIPKMMSDLVEWYDGYKFNIFTKEKLFNPDMLLYFLKEYGIMNEYPLDMLDTNVVSDYRKIRAIFRIGNEEMSRLEILDELTKIGNVDFTLTRLYNMEAEFTDEDFLSLLFYMGMLTVKEGFDSLWSFKIPNYVIKKLYFEYFASLSLEKTKFAKASRPIQQSIQTLVNEANPEPFLKIVETVLQESHSNRDEMNYGEKHLKTLIIALLFPYKSFKIQSEYEENRHYPDIFLERIPDRKTKYEVVIELKYIKKSQADTAESVVEEAKTQLQGYMQSERFSRNDVRGFYIVFVGGVVYKCDEVTTDI